MLKRANVQSRGKPHDYPKMILSYLLVLEYQRSIRHYTILMMSSAMAVVNEERGEIMFSLLGMCALGDPMKSDFQHMNAMYKLLPVYRSVKKEIMEDCHRKDSIAWHHTIPADSPEVAATAFFFNRVIDDIVRGTYGSYDHSLRSYGPAAVAHTWTTAEYMPVVYILDVAPLVEDMLSGLRRALSGNFVRGHGYIWPPVEVKENAPGSVADSNGWGPPWSDCKEGHYAVARGEFSDSSMGLCCYLVQVKHPQRIVNRQPVQQFTGKEIICTARNTTQDCIGAAWQQRPSAHSVEVDNWSVIAYFESFTSTRRLPTAAVRDIELVMENEDIFLDVGPGERQ